MEKTSNNFGMLSISWEGKKMLIDTKLQIFLNGLMLGEYSFVQGFRVESQIMTSRVEIVIKAGIRTYEKVFDAEKDMNYFCNLVYNRALGDFIFDITNGNGMKLMPDARIPSWQYIVFFLVPVLCPILLNMQHVKKGVGKSIAYLAAVGGFIFGVLGCLSFASDLDLSLRDSQLVTPLSILFSIMGGGFFFILSLLSLI